MTHALRALAAVVAVLVAASCAKDERPTYGDNLAQAMRDGRATGARGDLQTLAMALASYVDQNGTLPAAADGAELAALLEPTHVRRAPQQDPWGAVYGYSTDGSSYTLTSPGADGISGTADDFEMADGQITKNPIGRGGAQ